MKFTYTHITKDYTEITVYNTGKNNKVSTNQIRLERKKQKASKKSSESRTIRLD